MSKQGVYLRSVASDATEATIDIIGIIGWSVAYEQMRNILRSVPENIKRVVFDIYSPGGDVWEGNGIIQEIGELGKRAETVARVQVAASMATLIAAACNHRTIAANGRFLIHNAWTSTIGDAAAHEKAAQTLRDAESEAAKFYALRTGKTVEEMQALMNEERWLMPEETKSLGFVQEICDPFKPEEYEAVKEEIVAAGKWPKALVDIAEPETKEQFSCECIKCGHQMNSENHCKDVKCPECGGQMRRSERPGPGQHGKEEGTKDGNTSTSGAAPIAAVEPDATQGADAQNASLAVSGEYEKGRTHGIAQGRSEMSGEFAEQIVVLKEKVHQAESEARKHQSEKDRLSAELAQAKKAGDARLEAMRVELDKATDRLRKFVTGALTFSPTIETWEEAMVACGGDYPKAAKEYPELLKQYRVRKTQERGERE